MAKCSDCREKRASFARAGAEKPLRCGGCRVAGDVNMKHKKCGCGKQPSFGPPGGKRVHCAGCRVDGDVNLVSKMCSTCREKHPVFAPTGAKRAVRCGGCRVAGDVDVKNKKCGCGIQPTFGPPGGKAVHCSGCRVSTWLPGCVPHAVKNIPLLPPLVPSARSGAVNAAWRGM
jgi:hypothetical protein